MIKFFTTIASVALINFLFIELNGQGLEKFTYLREEENISEFNNSHFPCISSEEYAALEIQCAANIRILGLDKSLLKNRQTTSLIWPLKAAEGFTDCDFYFIGAYVDQNTSLGLKQDYDCGSNTYDGHHGTDITLWPYGFYKMDNNQVEVIAAAAGTIIQKEDGNFDRNCAANNLTANSIIIQHADGSRALYWHMKKNSLTNKVLGQTVAQGEYLGVVGSSGSSSGPHLHFEVWSGSSNTTYIDPYSGICNTINNTSWWQTQRAHHNPAVIKVSTNTTELVLTGCPNSETPHEATSFEVPFQGPGLPQGFAKFYIFLREAAPDTIAECKIINPNGSVFNSWTFFTSATKWSIAGFSKLLPTIPGSYSFQATHNGVTCSQRFDISQATGYSDMSDISSFEIITNPTSASFALVGLNIDNGKYNFKLTTTSGQIASSETAYVTGNSLEKMFSTSSLPNGIYVLLIESENNRISKKFVVLNH